MEESESEPVRVFVRLRPEPLFEPNGSRRNFERCVRAIDDKTIRFSPPDAIYGSRKGVPAVDDKIYTFDAVFDEQASQEQIYEMVRSNVKATVKGFNTTIFAYGSTGSGEFMILTNGIRPNPPNKPVGKSHTMTGSTSQPGIIPRAISEVFAFIEAAASQESDVFFYVRLSYVELYNNNFRNLLEFAAKELSSKEKADDLGDNFGVGLRSRNRIEVRESQAAGVFLAGPHLRIPVTSAQEAFSLISRGNKSRAVGATQCNDVSSRSHAILTVHVESRVNPKGGETELRLGKMHLVDLAGSERVTMSGAEGDTLTETQNINLSLSAIGDVLSALSKNATVMSQLSGGAKSPPMGQTWPGSSSLVPVPYRNSKLTHLLKDSLGGNSKTIMITTIRTSSEYASLTSASLMYSSRAKKIRNRSLVNHNVIGDTGIAKVTSEIERLRSRLDERTREFERLRQLHLEENKENLALKTRLQELQLANEFEKRELETQMSQVIHSQAGELAMQKERIVSLQSALEQELSVSLNRIAEQEREIKWLQKALDETSETPEGIAKLREELVEWRTQAQQAQSSLALELRRTEQLSSNYSALTRKVAEYEEVMQELAQEKEDLTASSAQLQDELNYATYGVRAMEVKCVALEEKLKAVVEEGVLRDSQLRDASLRMEELRSAKADLELRNKDLADSVAALRTEETSLKRENSRLKTLLEQSVGALEKETVSALDSASKRASLAETTRARLEAQLAVVTTEATQLKTQLDEQAKDMIRLKQENEMLRNKVGSQELEDGKVQGELTSLKRNDKELRFIIDRLRSELATKSAELEDRSTKYAADLELRVLEVQALKRNQAEELGRESEQRAAETEAVRQRNAMDIARIEAEVRDVLQAEQSRSIAFFNENERLKAQLLTYERSASVEGPTVIPDIAFETEMNQLRNEYEKRLADQESEHRTSLEEALSTQRVKYKLLLKEKLGEVQRNYETELARKLQEMESLNAEERNALNLDHEAMIGTKNAEIDRLKALLTVKTAEAPFDDDGKDLHAPTEAESTQLTSTFTAAAISNGVILPEDHNQQAELDALKLKLEELLDEIKGSNGTITYDSDVGDEGEWSLVYQLGEAYNEKIESLWAMISEREEAMRELEDELKAEANRNASLESEQSKLSRLIDAYTEHACGPNDSERERSEAVGGSQPDLQQRLTDVLNRFSIAKTAEVSQLRSGFDHILEETRRHVENEWRGKFEEAQGELEALEGQLVALVEHARSSNGEMSGLRVADGGGLSNVLHQLVEAYNEGVKASSTMIAQREGALHVTEDNMRKEIERAAVLEAELRELHQMLDGYPGQALSTDDEKRHEVEASAPQDLARRLRAVLDHLSNRVDDEKSQQRSLAHTEDGEADTAERASFAISQIVTDTNMRDEPERANAAFGALQNRLEGLAEQIRASNGMLNYDDEEQGGGGWSSVHEVSEAYNEKIESLWAMISEREEAMRELEDELKAEADRNASLETQLNELRTLMHDYSGKILDFKKTDDAWERRLEEELLRQGSWYDQRLKELREEHIAAQSHCESISADVISRLEDEVAATRLELDAKSEEVLRLQESLEKVVSEGKAVLEAILREKDAEMSGLIQELKASHAAALLELENRLVVAEERNASAVSELEEQILNERRLKFEAIKAEAEHAVAEAEQRLRDEHNAKLSQLISRHALEVEALQGELTDTRNALSHVAEEYQTLASLLEDTESSFEDRIVERLQPMQQVCDELKTANNLLREVNLEVSESYAKINSEHQELQHLLLHVTEDRDRELEQLRQALAESQKNESTYKGTNDSLNQLLTRVEEELNAIRKAEASMSERHAEDMQRLNDEHEEMHRELILSNEIEVRALVEEKVRCFARVDELEGRIEAMVAEHVRNSDSELAKLREEHARELLTIESRNREAVARLQLEFDSREEELLESHRKSVREMRAACEADIAAAEEWSEKTLQRRLAEGLSSVEEKMSALEISLADKDGLISALTEELKLVKSESEQKLLKLVNEYESVLEASRHSFAESETKLEESMERIRIDHAADKSALLARHEAEVSALKADFIKNMEDQTAALLSSYQYNLESSRREHSKSEEHMFQVFNAQVQERDGIIKELRVKLTEMGALLAGEKTEAAAAACQSEAERSQLRSQLESHYVAILNAMVPKVQALASQHAVIEQRVVSRHEAEVQRIQAIAAALTQIQNATRLRDEGNQRDLLLLRKEVDNSAMERDALKERIRSLEEEKRLNLAEMEEKWIAEVATLSKDMEELKSKHLSEIEAIKESLATARDNEIALFTNAVAEATAERERLEAHVKDVVSTISAQLHDATQKAEHYEQVSRKQGEEWREERERLLEAHRRDLQEANDQRQAQLLESEREHIVRLELVHEQLREVETRHSARVERFENSIALAFQEKEELLRALHDKERLLEDLKDQMEDMQRRYEGCMSDNVKAMVEVERRRIDASYRNEIAQVVERATRLQEALADSSRASKVLEEKLTDSQKELFSITLEKKVLEDIYAKFMEGKHVDSLSELRRTIALIVKEQSTSGNDSAALRGNSHAWLRIPLSTLIDTSRRKIPLSSRGSISTDADDRATSKAASDVSVDASLSSLHLSRNPRTLLHESLNGTTLSQPSTPSRSFSRSSPADALAAAILEGDAQTVQMIVRGKAGDLRSSFWKELMPAVLPMHKAISGLHYHGSERLLISVLSVLIQLGADINATDPSGSTVLHRALSICTSKSVVSVLELLLVQGADPNLPNKEGETPLLFECKR